MKRHNNSTHDNDPLAVVPEGLLSTGERGERYARLIPTWPDFLEQLNELGPLLGGCRRGGLTLLQPLDEPDFQPVPGSREFVELRSGWVVDAGQIASILAVDESAVSPHPRLSLQFFDAPNRGLLKLILTAKSCKEALAMLVAGSVTAEPWKATSNSNSLPENTIRCRCRAEQHNQAPRCALIKSLLLAYQHHFPISFTLTSEVQHYTASLIPHHVERVGDDFLVTDGRVEIHLANVPEIPLSRITLPSAQGPLPVLRFPVRADEWCELRCSGNRDAANLWAALHSGSGDCLNG